MTRIPAVTIRIDGRLLLAACLALLVLAGFAALPDGPSAQKSQEDYGDKFNIADSQGGVAMAASSDGKYVFVAGPQGVLVSDDFGRTGSWSQTVKLK